MEDNIFNQNASETIVNYLDNISIRKDVRNLGELHHSNFYENGKNESWFMLLNYQNKIIGFWWHMSLSKNKKEVDEIEECADSLINNGLIKNYPDVQCYIYYFPVTYPIYSLAYKIHKEFRNGNLSLLINKKDFILKTYETIDFIKENLPLLIIISSANFFILVGLINITEDTPIHLSKIPKFFPIFFKYNIPKGYLIQYYSYVVATLFLLIFLFVFILIFWNAVFAYFMRKILEICNAIKSFKKMGPLIYDTLYFFLAEIPLISTSLIIEAIIWHGSNNKIDPFLPFAGTISVISFILALLFSKKIILKSFDYPYVYYLMFFTIIAIVDGILFI